jgi:uncharacterized protein with NAD-binding domain and iron-sulfur cluster
MVRRVAILGGGTAALTAAFALSRRVGGPEITVYQQGWRLGGKGASSRDPGARNRNEEHGLHVLAGFYHNAFAVLRDCYAEWALLGHPVVAFDAAFTPKPDCTLMEQGAAGWRPVDLKFPEDSRLPGVSPTELGIEAMVLRIVQFILGWVGPQQTLDDRLKARAVGAGSIEGLAAEAEALLLTRAARGDEAEPLLDLLPLLLRRIRDLALLLEPSWRPKAREPNPFMVGAVAAVCALGIVEDRLFERGFSAIDDQELLDWMASHGANQRVLASPYVRAGYDYAFAYVGGETDPAKPSIAAGVALRAFLRLTLTYHQSLFFHMQGGMGEAVFTPLYEVLRARGVRFRFFHRVRSIALDTHGEAVDTVTLQVQARPLAGPEGYTPLVRDGDRRVWPPRPRYGLLQDGDQLAAWGDDLECRWAPDRGVPEITLTRGDDFDDVVLGISVGALGDICADLAARKPAWREMLDASRTAPVAGIQVWSGPPVTDLGWPATDAIATAFAQPFATWCDMSYLLPREVPGDPVRQTLSYLCAPFPPGTPDDDGPGSNYPAEQQRRVGALFDVWAARNLIHLLPGAVDPVTGAPRPDFALERFIRANVSPSDHYVLSPPGSITKRLRPGQSGVCNLFLAGDWTKTGLDAGAFEAAVMSGLQCARAAGAEAIVVYGEDDVG